VLLEDGQRWEFHGKGAGRWPTAEAVIGDALEVVRLRQSSCPVALSV
jgi:homoserine dehydrogenase